MTYDYDTNSDWTCAFQEAGIPLDEVASITRRTSGANDEADWLATGVMRDGRTFAMRAGCDYTGWDCQASGEVRYDDPGFFTVDEQVRLERDGRDGWWMGWVPR